MRQLRRFRVILPVVLVCIFVLTSGCFSIPELGIRVNEEDNRSKIVPFFGEVKNDTIPAPDENATETGRLINESINATTQNVDIGEWSIIDWVIALVVMFLIAALILTGIKFLSTQVKLEDSPTEWDKHGKGKE